MENSMKELNEVAKREQVVAEELTEQQLEQE